MAAVYPELDRLVRAAMVESVISLHQEAVLDNEIPLGYPPSTFCRWCSNDTHRLLKQGMRNHSMRVTGLLCRWCDKTAAVCPECNDTVKMGCLEGHDDG